MGGHGGGKEAGMSEELDPAAESMMQTMERMMRKACEGTVKIPENCFAIIRLPVTATAFSGFALVCEKMSPKCVTSQYGEFLMVMHAEKKEGEATQELLEALEYIVGDSVTFLRDTAIEKAKAAIAKAKGGQQ